MTNIIVGHGVRNSNDIDIKNFSNNGVKFFTLSKESVYQTNSKHFNCL